MFCTFSPRITSVASAAGLMGTVPILKKPVVISTHVSHFEYMRARNNRNPKTTTSLKVITAFSDR